MLSSLPWHSAALPKLPALARLSLSDLWEPWQLLGGQTERIVGAICGLPTLPGVTRLDLLDDRRAAEMCACAQHGFCPCQACIAGCMQHAAHRLGMQHASWAAVGVLAALLGCSRCARSPHLPYTPCCAHRQRLSCAPARMLAELELDALANALPALQRLHAPLVYVRLARPTPGNPEPRLAAVTRLVVAGMRCDKVQGAPLLERAFPSLRALALRQGLATELRHAGIQELATRVPGLGIPPSGTPHSSPTNAAPLRADLPHLCALTVLNVCLGGEAHVKTLCPLYAGVALMVRAAAAREQALQGRKVDEGRQVQQASEGEEGAAHGASAAQAGSAGQEDSQLLGARGGQPAPPRLVIGVRACSASGFAAADALMLQGCLMEATASPGSAVLGRVSLCLPALADGFGDGELASLCGGVAAALGQAAPGGVELVLPAGNVWDPAAPADGAAAISGTPGAVTRGPAALAQSGASHASGRAHCATAGSRVAPAASAAGRQCATLAVGMPDSAKAWRFAGCPTPSKEHGGGRHAHTSGGCGSGALVAGAGGAPAQEELPNCGTASAKQRGSSGSSTCGERYAAGTPWYVPSAAGVPLAAQRVRRYAVRTASAAAAGPDDGDALCSGREGDGGGRVTWAGCVALMAADPRLTIRLARDHDGDGCGDHDQAPDGV